MHVTITVLQPTFGKAMVIDKVKALLDDLKAKQEPIPSIRQIRTMIGSGSLTTISDAVRQWKYEQLQAVGQTPEMTEDDIAAFGDLVWKAVEPFVQKKVNRINELAEARVVIEAQEAAKLKAVAVEILAEAESKEKAVEAIRQALNDKTRECVALSVEVDALKREIEKLRETLQEVRTRNDQLQVGLEQVRDRAVAAEAEVKTLKSVMGLLQKAN